MRITLGHKEYEFNEERATKLGILKEIIKRKPGQVWHAGGTDILLLVDDNYACIAYLEKGSKCTTRITEAWFTDATLLGENLADYYAKKLAKR